MAWTAPMTAADDAVYTHTEFNANVRDNLNFLKANQSLGDSVELTIATGAVTKTKSYHTIDTESDAATDDLDTINGGSDGDVIYIQAAHADRTIVLKDETGNIHVGTDVTLNDTHKVICLIYNATTTDWHSIGTIAKTRTFTINAMESPLPETDWVASLLGATLAQNKSAKKFWIPLSFFKIGDILISYKLVGDVVEATAATLDCKLVRVNKADPITSSDLAGGGITQVDADGNFDSEATLTTAETIATDKQYILEISGTTGSSDSITVMGAEVTVIRLL